MSDETDTDRQNDARAAQLVNLDRLSQNFGRSLSGALARSATSGRSLDGVLGTLGARLATLAAKAAAKPLQAGFRSLFDSSDGPDSEESAPTFAGGPSSGAGGSRPSRPAGSWRRRPTSPWRAAPG